MYENLHNIPIMKIFLGHAVAIVQCCKNSKHIIMKVYILKVYYFCIELFIQRLKTGLPVQTRKCACKARYAPLQVIELHVGYDPGADTGFWKKGGRKCATTK